MWVKKPAARQLTYLLHWLQQAVRARSIVDQKDDKEKKIMSQWKLPFTCAHAVQRDIASVTVTTLVGLSI